MHDQLFVFSVLLFSAFVAPIIADRTKIPSIVFYILFGVILERFVFELGTLGQSFSIFSDVGMLYLMFIAGLELDFFLFKKNVAKSAVFGVLTFIIPQVLGTIIIINAFGYSMNAALLIASFFASHTLLSLIIINKFGIENSEPVSVAVGASIISDIAVLALLAVVADISRGVNVPPIYWVMMFGSWVLLISAIMYVVPKVARKVFQVFSEDGNAQFLFVFATVCLLSWTAHSLRLKPLIGAFFCGLALSRLVPNRSILMTKISFVGYTFFIPFFFISAGMHINPQRSSEFIDALILGVILTALTIATKTIAAVIFGKIYKYSWDAVAMTAGMTFQQAATTIVCAVVGLEVGIIDETIFNAAMILILLSCTIGEVISVHFAGKYAQNLSKKVSGSSPFESKTLVFVPNITACRNLLDFADFFKFQAKKHIISPLALAGDCRESIADAETILGFCMNHATEIEYTYHPEMRIAANAVDGILRGAAETRADLVVCPFENYSPTLIDECPPRLVFARITAVIATTKRIRVVFMPTSENRADLSLFLAEIKNLSQQASADVIFYMTDNQGKKINEKIHKYLKDSIKYKIVSKANCWNAIKRDLPEQILSNDIVIFSMATRHKLFRLPSIEKFPFLLSEKFTQNSIFTAYPPLSMVGSEDDYGQLNDVAQGIPDNAELEAIETSSNDFREIAALIAQKIEAGPNEVYDTLLPSLELYPEELIPGTVIVHAHTEVVADPRIFIWFQSEQNTILPAKIAPNVLIVVLNPLHGDPHEHLKTLARIAGLFMKPEIREIINNSQNSAELAERLRALN